MSITIRRAAPAEYHAIGELTAYVYVDAGFARPDDDYVTALRDAEARARAADLLVALDETDTIVGSVTYTTHDGAYAEIAADGEAEFRMLAVHPVARKKGVGAALVQAVLDRARRHGCRAVRLSSAEPMTDAHRLYERLGFHRTPDRDWFPYPDLRLVTYELPL